MHISELLSFHIHAQHPLVEPVPIIAYESHRALILFDNIYHHTDIGSSYILFNMYDGDYVSATSSPSDPQSGSKYTDHTWSSDAYPPPPQEANGECVCKLSVKLLLENGRFVVNSQNSYEGVGYWNSFQDEVQNDYFPYSLGGKCVEVGVGNLEFWVEYYDMQCLACGKRTEFNMYQDILRYEVAMDGYTRPRLVSVQFMLSICNN